MIEPSARTQEVPLMSTVLERAGSLRVLFVCTGIGVINRGIESFAAECFGALKDCDDVDFRLAATKVTPGPQTFRIWSMSRNTRSAEALGAFVRRNGYVVEQLSSLLPLVRVIRRFQPDVVFTSEANLTYQLFRWRNKIGVPFRLLFSNGGPCGPVFPRMDFIHQVAPFYTQLSLNQGDLDARHITVPYGIGTPAALPVLAAGAKRDLRRRLQLPEDRPILLSVGNVDRHHKRMDYLIREVAALPSPRPFLVILGHQDRQSEAIVSEGNAALGSEGFIARAVPYNQVFDYYRAADVFSLCSLREGFGRVYLEAAMHGLPVISHRHPVMEYVLQGIGELADLSSGGGLTSVLAEVLARTDPPEARQRRWETVRKRFDWSNLRREYVKMFRHCTTTKLPWLAARG